MRIFKTLWEIIKFPADLQGLLTAIGLGSVVGGVTAWIATALGERGHWVIIAALAALALILAIWLLALVLYRKTSTFQQVRVTQIAPMPQGTGNAPDGSFAVTFSLELFNRSERNIFYKIKRCNQSIQGKSPSENNLDPNVNVVQPNSSNSIVLATVDGIDRKKPVKGNIEVEFLYGASKDRLSYLFAYISEPVLIINETNDGKNLQVHFVSTLKKQSTDMRNVIKRRFNRLLSVMSQGERGRKPAPRSRA